MRAAAQVFADKGYHTARISDVADLAGVAQGTIYRFFTSKEELATSLANNGVGHLEELIVRATEAARAGGDPTLALDIFLDEAAAFYHRHRQELTAIHSWSLDPSTRALRAGWDDKIAKQLRTMMKSTGVRIWHPPGVDVSRLILMLLYSLSSQMEHYGAAADGDAQIVAQVIKKVIYADGGPRGSA
jgi:AcrR family transcriptional regulator